MENTTESAKDRLQRALCRPIADYFEESLNSTSPGNWSGLDYEEYTPEWVVNGSWTAESAAVTQEETVDLRLRVELILYEKVVVVICCLGLFGNLLNLVVLTQKSLLYTLGRMEKFVYTGLISLALSDMFVCLAVIPHGFVEQNGFEPERTFTHFYRAYSNGVINTFVMCSTWLTVTMAAGRYFVTCHPFRAREMIGMTFAVRVMAAVLTLCVLFNLPRFWISGIDDIACEDGRVFYFVANGPLKTRTHLFTAYMWLYFCLCIMAPLAILTYCNVGLVRALRISLATRQVMRQGNSHTAHTEGSNRITLMLIIIILMNIFLVCPAEIITFVRDMALSSLGDAVNYNLAVACVNTLQALNFSTNFILYCAINAQFRRTMGALLRGRCFAHRRDKNGGGQSQHTMQDTLSNSTYHPLDTSVRPKDTLC